ncbi:hypothetical protein CPAR01_04040 [Colletotrichum paranaense]|uniref:Uncharacterized protein n=1 Tax=Colletotrichum paranaense TaxID=1914294 RepID=A0ABQ9SV77_9PEZI|nr:uncharacterized protein CPAR01_04040 [Colletotrichum paranaense]KAK1543407.1 hypothetical protein CPAR01_04040 [Colletotrichum paranaense]
MYLCTPLLEAGLVSEVKVAWQRRMGTEPRPQQATVRQSATRDRSVAAHRNSKRREGVRNPVDSWSLEATWQKEVRLNQNLFGAVSQELGRKPIVDEAAGDVLGVCVPRCIRTPYLGVATLRWPPSPCLARPRVQNECRIGGHPRVPSQDGKVKCQGV